MLKYVGYNKQSTAMQKNLSSINNVAGSTTEIASTWNKGLASLRELLKKE